MELSIDAYLAELEAEGFEIKSNEALTGFDTASNLPTKVDERIFDLRISTGDVDRGRDILVPTGMELKGFKLNPLFLWEHGRKAPREDSILGTIIEIGKHPTGIRARAQYVPLAQNPLPAKILELERQGLIPGNSIGWRPTGPVTRDEKTGIRRVTNWELLHVAKVMHPMNPNAVRISA